MKKKRIIQNLFTLPVISFTKINKIMNTSKFLVGGIIGGIANFLLGWVVWGMLLMNFMKEHSTEAGKAAMRPDEDTIWWALIVANLLLGFLLSYILNKGGVNSAGAGAAMGAVVGLLSGAAMDLLMYAFMDSMDTTALAVDVLASMVVTAIVGAIIGWYLGRGAKPAVA
jgi:hypothetical protein